MIKESETRMGSALERMAQTLETLVTQRASPHEPPRAHAYQDYHPTPRVRDSLAAWGTTLPSNLHRSQRCHQDTVTDRALTLDLRHSTQVLSGVSIKLPGFTS